MAKKEEYYGDVFERSNRSFLKYKKYILNRVLKSRKVSSILDLGCFQGFINNFNFKNNSITGLDFDSEALKIAKEKGYITINHDLNSNKPLPFTNKQFDIILVLDTLEHLVDPEKTLQECNRILKDDGIIVIGLPNSMNIFNRLIFSLGKTKDITDVNHHFKDKLFSDHLHLISLNKAKRVIATSQFKIEKSEFYLQKKIRQKNLRFFQIFLSIARFFKLQNHFPELFSFAFIFFCTKKLNKTQNK